MHIVIKATDECFLVTKINAFHFIGTAWNSSGFFDLGSFALQRFIHFVDVLCAVLRVVTQIHKCTALVSYMWLPHSLRTIRTWPTFVRSIVIDTPQFHLFARHNFSVVYLRRYGFYLLALSSPLFCMGWCQALNLTIYEHIYSHLILVCRIQ